MIEFFFKDESDIAENKIKGINAKLYLSVATCVKLIITIIAIGTEIKKNF